MFEDELTRSLAHAGSAEGSFELVHVKLADFFHDHPKVTIYKVEPVHDSHDLIVVVLAYKLDHA